MGKADFEPGTSTLAGYFGWINARHRIYEDRKAGAPFPWTEDEIFCKYKFTNAFRQLDRGTVALADMLRPWRHDARKVVFNTYWYRLFNLDVHANSLGAVAASEEGFVSLQDYMHSVADRGDKIFTSAHMTTGQAYRSKVDTYLEASHEGLEHCDELIAIACNTHSMREVFEALLPRFMVGRFVAYEMVCDMRFYPTLWGGQEPVDTLSWANVGPGARRGLVRLGLIDDRGGKALQEVGVEAMRKLYTIAGDWLGDHVKNAEVPFELREIEHSLCEFDKYERARLGHGAPRQRFHPPEGNRGYDDT